MRCQAITRRKTRCPGEVTSMDGKFCHVHDYWGTFQMQQREKRGLLPSGTVPTREARWLARQVHHDPPTPRTDGD